MLYASLCNSVQTILHLAMLLFNVQIFGLNTYVIDIAVCFTNVTPSFSFDRNIFCTVQNVIQCHKVVARLKTDVIMALRIQHVNLTFLWQSVCLLCPWESWPIFEWILFCTTNWNLKYKRCHAFHRQYFSIQHTHAHTPCANKCVCKSVLIFDVYNLVKQLKMSTFCCLKY